MFNQNTKYTCRQCGKCCLQEIPLTINDVYRVAKTENTDPGEVFVKIVNKEVSGSTGVFKINKKANGECVFLEENTCSIQDYKPIGCSLFFCMEHIQDKQARFIACNRLNDSSKIWEQSVSKMITREYVKRNGTTWNKPDFYQAVTAIQDHIITHEKQKIRLGRRENGQPVCQIYNCSECQVKGKVGSSALITIDDISRIAKHMEITVNEFFNQYVSAIRMENGVFVLKKKVNCVFFDPETHCQVEDVKPLHCKFTPCPRQTGNDAEYDTFYLGSGTIEEQYRHQLSLNFTREYVMKHGLHYNRAGMKLHLHKLEDALGDENQFTNFCRNISKFRFVQDCSFS